MSSRINQKELLIIICSHDLSQVNNKDNNSPMYNYTGILQQRNKWMTKRQSSQQIDLFSFLFYGNSLTNFLKLDKGISLPKTNRQDPVQLGCATISSWISLSGYDTKTYQAWGEHAQCPKDAGHNNQI